MAGCTVVNVYQLKMDIVVIIMKFYSAVSEYSVDSDDGNDQRKTYDMQTLRDIGRGVIIDYWWQTQFKDRLTKEFPALFRIASGESITQL